MDIKQKIGTRLKELRNNLGISQEALANKANLDRTYVTDVENGRRNIGVENLEKLIIALGNNITDFFNSKTFTDNE